MCVGGSLGESPRTPGKDPEQPTPLGDLGPALMKVQRGLGKPRGAKPATVGAGDSQASTEPVTKRGPSMGHGWKKPQG